MQRIRTSGSTSQAPRSRRRLDLDDIERLATSKATLLLAGFSVMRASPLALQRLVPRHIPAHLVAGALSEALYFRLVCMGAWMRVSVLLSAGEEHLSAALEIVTGHLREQLEDKLWEVEEDYEEDFPDYRPRPGTIRQQVHRLIELGEIQDEDILEILEDAEELQDCIDVLSDRLGETAAPIPDPLELDDRFHGLRTIIDYALRDANLETLVCNRESLGDRSTAERVWRSLDEAARRTYRDRDGRYPSLQAMVIFTPQTLLRLQDAHRQRELARERHREMLRERSLQAQVKDDGEEPPALCLFAMSFIINPTKIVFEEPESLPRYFVKRRHYEKVWEIIFSRGKIKGRIKPDDLEKALVEIGFTKQQRKGSAVFFEHPDKDSGRPPFPRHELHGRDLRAHDHQKLARHLNELYGWTLEWFGIEDESTRAERRKT